jgi:hypothetical protein
MLKNIAFATKIQLPGKIKLALIIVHFYRQSKYSYIDAYPFILW